MSCEISDKTLLHDMNDVNNNDNNNNKPTKKEKSMQTIRLQNYNVPNVYHPIYCLGRFKCAYGLILFISL